MTARARCLVALIVASGCTHDVDGSDGALLTDHCRLEGFGMLENGDLFAGDVRREPGGVPTGSWSHQLVSTTGEAGTGTPDVITCRINGRDLADVDGTFTIDGVSYAFHLFAEDRGEPGPPEIVEGTPEVRTMTATRHYRPSRWDDARIDERLIATIPSELPVTVGNAGNRWAWLTFQRTETFDVVTCRYRGGASTPLPSTPAELAAGERYHLERCTGEWLGTDSVEAGSRVDVRWIELHVQQGAHMLPSRDAAETTVTLGLDVTPLIVRERPKDFYQIQIRDAASGVLVHESAGDVVVGDLEITRL